MSRSPFGWDYPAGAANDPNAPWNQCDDHHPSCPQNGDFDEDDIECAECGTNGNCWLYAWLPYWLASRLADIKWLKHRFTDRYCVPDDACKCDSLGDD